ncbi:uncharacterized protein DFL_002874 [Arthrobotrys flagrans]|uniref:Uncharacterized protein n=1 Tax=Arthrobotrys flagrans TaxID=97331 RepID=A0A437AC89_ARTFL|nr:hypothetical protein DFL_002874 [Arthrobotrys flagrans]
MAPSGSLAMSQSNLKRGVQEDLATFPETIGNWDKCMEKSWCKYPLIAGCVVGALVFISIAWCCYRCCCRGRRKKADRSKSTFFNDPVPSYMSHPPPRPAAGGGYSSSNTIGPNTQTPAPQYAYFESGTTGPKDNDALPVMPSWNGSKNEKVEDASVKVETIELEDVSSSSTPPPSNNRLHSNNADYRPNFQPQQSQNLDPFGPQRLNNPFGPQPPSGPPAFPPPNRLDDFDFNPHINAQNQGPYANAEIYPPEPSYRHQQTGVTQPQQPQFTGTTSPPPPFQHQAFAGTTISGETHAYTPTPPPQALLTAQQTGGLPSHPTSPTPPPPSFNTSGATANGFNPANNPPPPQIPLPQNSSGGFVAQMDDDFGHSPVRLADSRSNNNNTGGGFNHNDFDHGGYSAYNNNQQQHGHQQGWGAF